VVSELVIALTRKTFQLHANVSYDLQLQVSHTLVLHLCTVPTQCCVLPTVANCNVSSLGTNVESDIYFQCDDGYTLFGCDRVSCDSNAQWSNKEPTCVGMSAFGFISLRVP
jgi:hypothetical protein